MSEPNRGFNAEFFIQAVGNRCIDFGGEASWALGGHVYIHSCNSSAAQKVRLRNSKTARMTSSSVSATYTASAPTDQMLGSRSVRGIEAFQRCDGSARQRFALDGDAILMGAQSNGRVTREFVIEPDRGFTNNRTPLVVGTREVNDANISASDQSMEVSSAALRLHDRCRRIAARPSARARELGHSYRVA